MTIEVSKDILDMVMRRAGTDDPKTAVDQALLDYLRPTSQKDLITLLGTCDDDSFLSPEELEKMRSGD